MTIDIRWVQARLKQLGFDPGPIDGIQGPRTDAAICAFKRSIGFRDRPYIGPLTLAALQPIAAPEATPTSIPWMEAAAQVRGLHEARDVSRLRAWFDRSVAWIDPREIPWCGAFVATCLRKADPDMGLPQNPLGARNWQFWGKSSDPVFGSVLVFWRISKSHWAGHVGFYHGEDATHYHVLGGNQSNAVTVSRVEKTRLLSSRWPADHPITGRRIHLTPGGIPVTINEM